MPKSFSAGFEVEKNKEASRPIDLYEIEINDSTTLSLAAYPENVTFDSQVYTGFGARHGEVKQSWEEDNPQLTVEFANVDQVFSNYLAVNDMRGNKIVLKMVFADALGDPANYMSEVYHIDHLQVHRETVVFVVTSKLQVLGDKVPGRTYLKNMCQWIYKSTECGYAGGLSTCDKTLAGSNGCEVHSNVARYGGFPSIPGNKTFFR